MNNTDNETNDLDDINITITDLTIKPDLLDLEGVDGDIIHLLLIILKEKKIDSKICKKGSRSLAEKLGWSRNRLKRKIEIAEKLNLIKIKKIKHNINQVEQALNGLVINTNLVGINYTQSGFGTMVVNDTDRVGPKWSQGGSKMEPPQDIVHKQHKDTQDIRGGVGPKWSQGGSKMEPYTYLLTYNNNQNKNNSGKEIQKKELDNFTPNPLILDGYRMKGLSDADINIALGEFKSKAENAEAKNLDQKFSNYLFTQLKKVAASEAEIKTKNEIEKMKLGKYKSKVESSKIADEKEKIFNQNLELHKQQQKNKADKVRINPAEYVGRAEFEIDCQKMKEMNQIPYWAESDMVLAENNWQQSYQN